MGREIVDDQETGWAVRAFARLLFVFVLIINAAPPQSDTAVESIDAARAAFANGHFAEAARIAETTATSRGFAIAAESLTIYAHFIAPSGEKEGLLQRSTEMARRAVRADPGNPDAHLQLARAIGRRAQLVGSVKAANRGYPEQIREATETALRLKPDLAAGHLGLGLWHAEIVGAVGPLLARLTYRANAKDAISSFQQAMKLAPESKAVYLEFAMGLLALNEKKYRDEVRNLLRRAIEIPAGNAYDHLLEIKAAEQLAILDSSGG
ncbi:MAG: hypothetical protein OXD29_05600 [Roseovarius sp.]|nr:hypothetical protein [Roseovarius sp.]